MTLRRPDYDDSPGSVSLPLTFEDIDWLVENNRSALKDQNRRQHLLARMRSTLITYRNAINDLHREISHLQSELATPQVTTSLNPADAARFLSDTQKEQLFVGSMRQAWAALLHLRSDAVNLKAQANSELGRARFAIQRILDTAPLDEAAREQLITLMDKLPAGDELILHPVPAPLDDLPDAAGVTVTTFTQAAAPGAQPPTEVPAHPDGPGRPQSDTDPAGTDPADTDPAGTDPADTDPADTDELSDLFA